MDLEIRASDDDRQRVVLALEHHTAAGRLRLSEFDERVAAALRAITLEDLAALTRDLPEDSAETHRSGERPGEPKPAERTKDGPTSDRSLLVAFMIAALTLVVLGTLLSLAR